jgi:DNA helicase-2/ATP-dependent DNA helicase PcrA
MEEELFPSQMMLSSRADLEEERRLFYVAITRAKQKLFLSYANTRYRYGRLNMCEPSRFLEEIDAKYLKMSRKVIQSAPQEEHKSHYARSLVAGLKKPEPAPMTKKAPAYEPSADFAASDTSNLAAGMKVEHPKFGFGKVQEIDTDGANRKAKVLFDNFGEKTLLLSFAKLKIHS